MGLQNDINHDIYIDHAYKRYLNTITNNVLNVTNDKCQNH